MAFTESNYRNWINEGEPFDKGVELYAAHGNSKALINLFGLGSNSYSKGKLRDALEGLVGQKESGQDVSKDDEIPDQVRDDEAEQVDESTSLPDRQTGETLALVHDELVRLYKQQSNLHSKMKVVRRKVGRKKLAFEILYLGKEIRQLQARKLYIETNGQEPPETSLNIEDITDRAALLRWQMNNRSYISKNKNSTDERRQKEVKKRINENREIAKLLSS